MKKINNYEGKLAIKSMSFARFYSEAKVMLSQVIEHVNKADLYSTNKEEERIKGNNHAQTDGPQSKIISYIEKNDSYIETLEPLCNALDNVKLGCPML